MARKRTRWSFSSGERGYTVRVEEWTVGSNIYFTFTDRRTGKPRSRSLKHKDRDRAQDFAKRLSERLKRGIEVTSSNILTLTRLFELNFAACSSDWSVGTKKEHRRRSELWSNGLGEDREASTVIVGEAQRIERMRSSGEIDARGRPVPDGARRRVRARTVEADVNWLIERLNWATNSRSPDGDFLLKENPLKGYHPRKEKNPRRAIATQDRLEALLKVSDQVTTVVYWSGIAEKIRSFCTELLILADGTGRRISAICQLPFQSLLLDEGPFGSIRWPASTDKMGRESVVPIGPPVRAAIDRILQERPGIGKGYLFPSPRDASKPLSYHLASHWLREAEKLAGLEKQDGALWHAFRRKWATERKHLSDIDVAAAGGWNSTRTLTEIYQQPDQESMLKVVLEGGTLRSFGDGA